MGGGGRGRGTEIRVGHGGGGLVVDDETILWEEDGGVSKGLWR